ncbi:hypothetical protein TNCV_3702761 [Trichonephila clavipes]|nr:hypothetical protein TNCV_3702761 [Trichonephila clavipes]
MYRRRPIHGPSLLIQSKKQQSDQLVCAIATEEVDIGERLGVRITIHVHRTLPTSEMKKSHVFLITPANVLSDIRNLAVQYKADVTLGGRRTPQLSCERT